MSSSGSSVFFCLFPRLRVVQGWAERREPWIAFVFSSSDLSKPVLFSLKTDIIIFLVVANHKSVVIWRSFPTPLSCQNAKWILQICWKCSHDVQCLCSLYLLVLLEMAYLLGLVYSPRNTGRAMELCNIATTQGHLLQ